MASKKNKSRAGAVRRQRKKARDKRKRKVHIAEHGSEGDNEVEILGEPATEGDAHRRGVLQRLLNLPRGRR